MMKHGGSENMPRQGKSQIGSPETSLYEDYSVRYNLDNRGESTHIDFSGLA